MKGARAILAHRRFADTARAIFDQCCQLTGATAGYVALLSDDGYENEVLFLEAGDLPCSVDPELPMPIRGLRALAYETHETVYENHFMDSDWVSYLPTGHVAMANVMFAPLNIEGRTVGIMGMANKPTDFTDEDAEIAAIFGEMAAVALVNSQYLEQLTHQTAALEKALGDVKTLSGLLPICCNCKKIRDDKGYWNSIEAYLSSHSEARFTHSYCDECAQKVMDDIDDSK